MPIFERLVKFTSGKAVVKLRVLPIVEAFEPFEEDMQMENAVMNAAAPAFPVYKPCFDLRYFHGSFNISLNEAFVKLLASSLKQLGTRKPLSTPLQSFIEVAETVLAADSQVPNIGWNEHFRLLTLTVPAWPKTEGTICNFYLITSREFGLQLLEAVDLSAGRDRLDPPLYALSEKLEERLFQRPEQRLENQESKAANLLKRFGEN
jgi:hypothetical protein